MSNSKLKIILWILLTFLEQFLATSTSGMSGMYIPTLYIQIRGRN
jgi:hypothetical protein